MFQRWIIDMFILWNSDDVGTVTNCAGTSTHWNNDNGALEQRLSLFKHFFFVVVQMYLNNCDKSKETCIAYVPSVPDQYRPEFRKTQASTK